LSNVYGAIIELLDNLVLSYIDEINMIIIERQMVENYKMTRCAQCVITYFLMKLKNKPLIPLILEVQPSLKSRQLNAPPDLNKRGIKKWAIRKARELLKNRNDIKGLNIFEAAGKKQDDLADTLVQIEAVMSFIGYPLTPDPQNYDPNKNDTQSSINQNNVINILDDEISLDIIEKKNNPMLNEDEIIDILQDDNIEKDIEIIEIL